MDADPIEVRPPSDDEAVCFAMSDSPTSLENAILCRLLGPNVNGNSASIDGGATWTTDQATTECPDHNGWMFAQYGADVTRWVTYVKARA